MNTMKNLDLSMIAGGLTVSQDAKDAVKGKISMASFLFFIYGCSTIYRDQPQNLFNCCGGLLALASTNVLLDKVLVTEK